MDANIANPMINDPPRIALAMTVGLDGDGGDEGRTASEVLGGCCSIGVDSGVFDPGSGRSRRYSSVEGIGFFGPSDQIKSSIQPKPVHADKKFRPKIQSFLG
jgi:hypothetical protein